MNDKRGFSLIELMAVIIIIGLILIIVLPAVSRLLTSNDTKQYENYVTIIKEGANVYSDYKKDDLGGSKDVGCINVSLEELIKEDYVKEFNEKNVMCSGNVRINNNKGNIKVSVNITCNDEDGKQLFKKEEIDQNGVCLSFTPEESD